MDKDRSSYNEIIKTTSIFGSSQVINILIGFVRTKITAILLGPAGIGIIGMYQSIIDTIRSISGLGVEIGSIKNISQTSDEHESLTKTITIFRHCFVFISILGTLIALIFCYPISIWIFDDTSYALPIALLSITIFFTSLKLGLSSILQGLRKISFMAKGLIAESIFGLLVVVPIYYFWGTDGILPVFILNSIIAYLCIYHYYKKLKVKQIQVSVKEVYDKGISVLKLGIFITTGTIINTLSMLLIRVYISHTLDIVSVGIFQAAWAITNVYASLILGATGTDYFPRLCKIAENKTETKKLVNEQSYIVLTIAAPIIIGMLLFSSYIIYILYSSEFTKAQTILQWQIIGTYFKVLASPIAYILLAKNNGKVYLLSEVAFFIVYLLFSYLLLPQHGIAAVGIGYMVAYIVYMGIVYMAGRNISDFKWDKENVRMILVNLFFIGIAACIIRLHQYQLLLGSFLFILSLIYAYKKLRQVFTLEELKDWFSKK